MNNSEWKNNAYLRYKQVLEGKDITFSNVFVPYWITYFKQVFLKDVLEIGCGPGVLSSIIAEFVNTLTCIEKDKSMARIAKWHNKKIPNVNIVNKDIENFTSTKEFDACFAHMVIHNINNFSGVLHKIRRIIKESGEFVFSIPHPCFYHFYKHKELCQFDYMKESEYKIDFVISKDRKPLPNKITYHHRNLETYTNLLSQTGFLVKGIDEIFPNNEVMKKYPSKWTYPRYLVFRTICIKSV